jgi:hypothetical protein
MLNNFFIQFSADHLYMNLIPVYVVNMADLSSGAVIACQPKSLGFSLPPPPNNISMAELPGNRGNGLPLGIHTQSQSD